MFTVIETPEFIATTAGIWTDEERFEFIGWIAANPHAGNVIPGTRGLRKVRWAAAGRGTRGGARVIYFARTTRGEVLLVTAYVKGRIENIPASLLRALSEKYHD